MVVEGWSRNLCGCSGGMEEGRVCGGDDMEEGYVCGRDSGGMEEGRVCRGVGRMEEGCVWRRDVSVVVVEGWRRDLCGVRGMEEVRACVGGGVEERCVCWRDGGGMYVVVEGWRRDLCAVVEGWRGDLLLRDRGGVCGGGAYPPPPR